MNSTLYRELFINAEKTFRELINGLKQDFSCAGCGACDGKGPTVVTAALPEECGFRHWQKLVLYRIKNEIEPDIAEKFGRILDYRSEFQCNRTGTCCKLASSEFSYDELKQKARNNDVFAGQFTEIFVPYTDMAEAREVFPEYVDLVLSRLEEGEEAYFYRCKYLEGSNICPIYENRPQICRDFPDNPYPMIPESCGYYQWREEVLVGAYTLHAMSAICDFYYEKLKTFENPMFL